MRRATRWLVAVVLIVHGVIHLLGAASGFGWGAAVSQLRDPIGPVMGVAWLAAGALVVIAGLLLVADAPWWWVVGAAAAVASQAVILTSWTDARSGSLANVILLMAVIYGYAADRPARFLPVRKENTP